MDMKSVSEEITYSQTLTIEVMLKPDALRYIYL